MLRDLYCYKPADAHGVSTQEKLCGSSAFLDLIEPFACTTLPNPGVMALKYGDPGYIEQDVSPMLYSITFSCLGFAILVVALRY